MNLQAGPEPDSAEPPSPGISGSFTPPTAAGGVRLLATGVSVISIFTLV